MTPLLKENSFLIKIVVLIACSSAGKRNKFVRSFAGKGNTFACSCWGKGTRLLVVLGGKGILSYPVVRLLTKSFRELYINPTTYWFYTDLFTWIKLFVFVNQVSVSIQKSNCPTYMKKIFKSIVKENDKIYTWNDLSETDIYFPFLCWHFNVWWNIMQGNTKLGTAV